jgi:hypothetical protein
VWDLWRPSGRGSQGQAALCMDMASVWIVMAGGANAPDRGSSGSGLVSPSLVKAYAYQLCVKVPQQQMASHDSPVVSDMGQTTQNTSTPSPCAQISQQMTARSNITLSGHWTQESCV